MSAFAAIVAVATPIPSQPVDPQYDRRARLVSAVIALDSAGLTTDIPVAKTERRITATAPVISADIAAILATDETRILSEEAAPDIVQPVEEDLPAPVAEADIEAPNPGVAESGDAETPDDENIIVVTAQEGAPPQDPLQRVNAETYEVIQDVDAALVEPVAKVYEKGLPDPIRKGLRNFFRNLGEPITFFNFLLQGKPGKAVETLGRFAINSSLGLGGLVDLAGQKPFNLPYRDNGFANTLGYYGVGPGPFLVVPLVGPTTLRDMVGGGLDNMLVPFVIGGPFTHPALGPTAYTVGSLDDRIEFDDRHQGIEDSINPYAVMRETYLCEREAEIEELRNREIPDCSLSAIEAKVGGFDPEESSEENSVTVNAGAVDGAGQFSENAEAIESNDQEEPTEVEILQPATPDSGADIAVTEPALAE